MVFAQFSHLLLVNYWPDVPLPGIRRREAVCVFRRRNTGRVGPCRGPPCRGLPRRNAQRATLAPSQLVIATNPQAIHWKYATAAR